LLNAKISLSFIAISFVPRVADLHALDHFTDQDVPFISCELCDILANLIELDPIIHGNNYHQRELQNIPSSFIVYIQYHTPLEKIVSPTFIHNKPPPIS